MLSVVEASPGRVPCEMDAEGTGRAPTVKGRRSALVCVMGSCRGIANMGTADASRRFAHYSFMVGTLPSRRLADDVPNWQHLATHDVFD